MARGEGWIVSRYVDWPGSEPVKSAWGWRSHSCDGNYTYSVTESEETQ
jgi:hypothetical protein